MDDTDHVQRSASRASTSAGGEAAVARSNTLKKRSSVNRKNSLGRSASRRSLIAGSVKGVSMTDGAYAEDDYNSALHTPIPTQSSPTEVLANRFQAWRAFLKSLITYFREVQISYETRAKAIMKVSNTVSNTQLPSVFMSDGGLSEATRILNDYHKHALNEANKAKDIEQDVIGALNGLRSDLGAKIKEIKGLHGDFKNSVEKEKENTRRAINAYQESLQHYDHADGFEKGRSDPFLVRLSVDRMVERQIDEENYLHRAYLNLESSGRELESIVVGEIQKAYNALAGIMKREGDDAFNTVDLLRQGPIALQKDLEWQSFVNHDPHLVHPDLPLRRVQDIEYAGKYHTAAAEIRAGMLERKSKYLKSYTAGWYVLSPTHIHEFKSADNIYSQPPVMSLYLGDQKLGSHSGPESSSHKFMLKGKQSGGVHRGHSWVFRAESHDTMMAWFDAIKSLTEKTGAEKTAYVRKHARSVSGTSARAMSITSSDGLDEDEDEHPYAASASGQHLDVPNADSRPQRPLPGGRFPSDLAVPRVRDAQSPDRSSEPDTEPATSPRTTQDPHFSYNTRPMTPEQDLSTYSGYNANPYALTGVATHESSPAQHRDRVASEAPMLVSQQSYQQPPQGQGLAATQTTLDQPERMRSHAALQQGLSPVSPISTSEHPLAPQSSPYAVSTISPIATSTATAPLQTTRADLYNNAEVTHPILQIPDDSQIPAATQTFTLPLREDLPVRQEQSEAAPLEHVLETGPGLQRPSLSDGPRSQSNYGNWMAPAATNAGLGLAPTSTTSPEHHERSSPSEAERTDLAEPVSRFSTSTRPSMLSTETTLSDDTVPTTADDTASDIGRVAPIKRQYTDFSVSGLHIPGEFPKVTTTDGQTP